MDDCTISLLVSGQFGGTSVSGLLRRLGLVCGCGGSDEVSDVGGEGAELDDETDEEELLSDATGVNVTPGLSWKVVLLYRLGEGDN